MYQGKHLTREERRRAQRVRANALFLVAAALLVALGLTIGMSMGACPLTTDAGSPADKRFAQQTLEIDRIDFGQFESNGGAPAQGGALCGEAVGCV